MSVVSLAAARERRREDMEQRAATRLRNALVVALRGPMHRLERSAFDVEEAASRCSDATLMRVYRRGGVAERDMLVAVLGEERLVGEMPVVMVDSTEEEAQ